MNDMEDEWSEIDMEEYVIKMVDDDRFNAIVPECLEAAKAAIVSRLYPMDGTKGWGDVPARYLFRACEIAVYIINKRGAEGELQHWENGTKRQYAAGSIPKDMLVDIVPFVSVPR